MGAGNRSTAWLSVGEIRHELDVVSQAGGREREGKGTGSGNTSLAGGGRIKRAFNKSTKAAVQ